MGLIYDPSESVLLMSKMQTNLDVGEQIVDEMERANSHLTSALSAGTLSGAAYTAGKGMFTQLVIPTVSKAHAALDQIRSELNAYRGHDSAAGSELLDEDKLNEQLQHLQAQQVATGNMINFYSGLIIAHPENNANGYNDLYRSFQQQLEAYTRTTDEEIRQIRDKLRRLHEFNTGVGGLFNESLGSLQSVTGGISFLKDIEFDSLGRASLSVSSNDTIPENVVKWIRDNAAGVAAVLSNGENASDVLKDVIGKGVQKFGGLITTLEGVPGPVGANSFTMVKPGGIGENVVKEGSKYIKYGKYAGKGFMVAGFAFGLYDDLVDEHKTVGEAVVHNGASMAVGYGAALGTTVVAGLFLSNPVGWAAIGVGAAAIGVGTLATWAFDKAYDSNFLGLKDGLDNIGKEVDNIGQAVGNVANAMNPFKWSW